METLGLAFYVGLIGVIAGLLAWIWVRGIDEALRDYPDYRGEDLLDEEPNNKHQK